MLLRHVCRVVLIFGLAGMAAGCAESTSTLTTGPSPAKCEVALTGTTSVESVGGPGTITVTTQPECVWNASTPSAWISGLSPASGQGSGRIEFRAAVNQAPTVREGEVVVNDHRLRVTQQAAPASCAYTVAPAAQTVASTGGTGSISITTVNGCVWSATSSASWLTLTGSASGTTTGTVTFSVAANTGGDRSATIAVGGQQATIRQSGVGGSSCAYAIAPVAQSFSAAGGAGGPVTVTTSAGCAWTARTTDSWITVTSGASGTGNGTTSFSVAANTGAARTGSITVAGEAFTVSQAAPTSTSCAYAIAPNSLSVAAAGGTAAPVTVTAGPTCGWTAAANVGWLTVITGASGTGNGTVTFSVNANDTAVPRTGSLTIAGHIFTVEQAAASCMYALNPSTLDVPGTGSGGSFEVQTLAGCPWTATSSVPWISITAGTSGSGRSFVSFDVLANPGGARTGTLTVAGQSPTSAATFTVAQAAASCALSISPTSGNPPATTTTNQLVTVTASVGTCTWTAQSNAAWLTITTGASGTGNGSVRYNVAANTGLARTGTLTIAGQTFTVTQTACAYELNPTSQHHFLAGATGRYVAVTNAAGCTWPWTSTSHVPWLTIDAPGSGTGAGSITYTVGPTTAPRSGTMTIAGQTFTAFQP